MSDKSFKLEMVTPSKTVFSGEVFSFSAPGVMGGFQVLYNHAPMVSEIGIGEVKIKKSNGEELHYATSGGYAEVADNHVILLAETIEGAGEIEPERAEEAYQRSQAQLQGVASEETRREIKQAIERAKNRIRIAKKRK